MQNKHKIQTCTVLGKKFIVFHLLMQQVLYVFTYQNVNATVKIIKN